LITTGPGDAGKASSYPDFVEGRIPVQIWAYAKGGMPVARERRGMDDLQSPGEFQHVFFPGLEQ
jgi:hypothetical protein